LTGREKKGKKKRRRKRRSFDNHTLTVVLHSNFCLEGRGREKKKNCAKEGGGRRGGKWARSGDRCCNAENQYFVDEKEKERGA